MDFILNGQGTGSLAQKLMASKFDTGILRPFLAPDGNTYCDLVVNGRRQAVPVHNPNHLYVGNNNGGYFDVNSVSTLRPESWKALDSAIVKSATPVLRAFGDLRSAGLVYSIPNGLGKTVLETEAMSDVGPATVSMDGTRRGEADRPLFTLVNFPLPIIHKDFSFPLRQIQASIDSGNPIDTTQAELAAVKVAEEVEKMTLGVSDFNSFAYGGGVLYGYKNFPHRHTVHLTAPTENGWSPKVLLQELISMKTISQRDLHGGPWIAYHGPMWDEYMELDYSDVKGEGTTRERLMRVQGITDIRSVDYLQDDWSILLVQQRNTTARAVIGMEMQTIQWEEKGGMELHYKVMCIMTAQLRADYYGRCGIVHASTEFDPET